MISKCEKSNQIRNYYIELEKLLISYKDNIVNDINNQLGIKTNNKKIIEENKDEGIIYILKSDEENQEAFKIGNSKDIENRMKVYNVGKISEMEIVFAVKTENPKEVEKCLKENLKSYQLKKNTELFNVDIDFIKETIKYCIKKNSYILIKNNKLLNKKDNKRWLIFIDDKNIGNIDEFNDLISKNTVKSTPKKSVTKKSSSKKSSSKKSSSKKSSSKKSTPKKSSSKKSTPIKSLSKKSLSKKSVPKKSVPKKSTSKKSVSKKSLPKKSLFKK